MLGHDHSVQPVRTSRRALFPVAPTPAWREAVHARVQYVVAALVTALGVLASSGTAEAIPAFARAYNTPCSTCHVAITRRGEFGDAFRRLGYHWPGEAGQDAEVRKEAPVEMRGTSLLEGLLPSRLPLSMSGGFSGGWTNDESALDSFSVGAPALNFLFGSALGENVSFFGTWSGNGGPNELYLHFARILGGPELNFKVGQFEQWTTLFRNNESLLSSFLLTSSGIAGHSVGAGRRGIEGSGVVWERGFWAAGLVQNGGPGSHYDPYYHLSYKIGGMDFLGEEPDIDFDSESPVDDLSVTLGHWGYLGEVADVGGLKTSDIRRIGLDLKVQFRQWSLWSGLMIGSDELATVPGEDLNSQTAFVELSYPVLPWLLPMVQAQVLDASNRPSAQVQYDVGAIFLLLDNLRGRLRVGYSDDDVKNEQAEFQLFFAL